MPKTTVGKISWRQAEGFIQAATKQKPERWMRGPHMMTLAVAARDLARCPCPSHHAALSHWTRKFNSVLASMDLKTAARVFKKARALCLFLVALMWGVATGLYSEIPAVMMLASFASGCALFAWKPFARYAGMAVSRSNAEKEMLRDDPRTRQEPESHPPSCESEGLCPPEPASLL